jgi:Phytanoyl-CoA dioxygenase (PhyH)
LRPFLFFDRSVIFVTCGEFEVRTLHFSSQRNDGMNLTELRERLLSTGYCYIEDVIPSDQLESVRRSVSKDVWSHSLLEPPTGYVPGFLRVNQSVAPFIGNERVLGLARSLFGPHVRISMLTGTVNGPGISRGALHADWPYNQTGAARIPAPYPDQVMHLTTMWMLTDFTEDNGATIIVPGTHKKPDHPRVGGSIDVDPMRQYPGERRLLGKAGTVAVLDSRLWHAVAPNVTTQERVAVIVRYAPWWLNLAPLRPGSIDREDIVESVKATDSQVPPLTREVFERLPEAVKPLLRHSLERA